MNKLSDLVEFNPTVRLKKGLVAPFIEMAALPTNARDIPEIGTREFSGSGSKFENGDTLFARITPCLENGKGGYVSTLGAGKAGHGSTEFIVMRARARADSLFVYYITRDSEFRRFAEKQMSGTSGRQRVAWQSLAEYELPIVEPLQRAAIAATLGALDDKIELNRKMNATLEAMARALFRDWFVDFGPTRAKMEARAPYLSPDLWSLFPDCLDDEGKPEGWEVFTLGLIAEHHTKSLTPAKMADGEVEHFSLPAFDKGQIPAIDHGATIKSNKTLVPPEAILLSKLNPEIPRIWMPETQGRLRQVTSTEFLAYTAKGGAGRSFLFCLFSDQGFREMLHGMVTGTSKSHQRISPPSLLGRDVVVGAKQMFGAFEKLVAPLLERVRANRAESRTLAQTRDLLLPRLMSGELRVADLVAYGQEAVA